MELETRFCTSADGTRVAYALRLAEAPPVLTVHGWATMVGPRAFEGWESSNRTLVAYDRRGSGLSTRDVEDISLDRQVEDLVAIVRALGPHPVDLLAYWDGSPIAIAFAAQYPERVRRMALYGPYLKGRDVISQDALKATMDLARTNWLMLRRSMMTMGGGDTAQVERGMERLRQGISPEMAARSIELYGTMDVEEYVDQVRAPTVVAHRPHDGAVTAAAIREVASRIRDCRLVTTTEPMPSRDPALRDFLDPMVEPAPSPADSATAVGDVSRFRTVLFTDLVAHTEMMKRLGDERGREVLREHELITRDAIKHHGGTEIKTDGDSFMVSFGSVTAAVDCAVELQRAFARRNEKGGEPLRVRIGLNAGEPIEENGDLFGESVILASRIKEMAREGEILIAEPVRHLLAGKEFVFVDRGEATLKGFDDAFRLYEVRWQL